LYKNQGINNYFKKGREVEFQSLVDLDKFHPQFLSAKLYLQVLNNRNESPSRTNCVEKGALKKSRDIAVSTFTKNTTFVKNYSYLKSKIELHRKLKTRFKC